MQVHADLKLAKEQGALLNSIQKTAQAERDRREAASKELISVSGAALRPSDPLYNRTPEEDGTVALPTSSWFGPSAVPLSGAWALSRVLEVFQKGTLKGLDLCFSDISGDPTAVPYPSMIEDGLRLIETLSVCSGLREL